MSGNRFHTLPAASVMTKGGRKITGVYGTRVEGRPVLLEAQVPAFKAAGPSPEKTNIASPEMGPPGR